MKRPYFFLLYIVLSLHFLVGCNKDKGTILPPEVELEEVRIENMAYGDHARQRMDVFLPKSRTISTPVLLMLHGGFWVEGDKSSFTAIQQQLLGMGYVCINLNYRYVSADNNYTGLMDDIGAALALVRDHSKEWGIADKGYHLAGFSAGGHMALLYAYSAKSPGEITSAISIAGPVGLTEDLIGDLASISPEIQEAVQWLAGAPLPQDEQDPNLVNYQLASPIFHIQNAVPTLLMHGSSDEVVPFSQSQTLKTALDHLQVQNQLVVLQGASHDVSLAPIHMIQILLELTNWLKAF
jgi:acetyl esterase/lipase